MWARALVQAIQNEGAHCHQPICQSQFLNQTKGERMTERVLTQGILSSQTSFRLLVDGPAGKKELARLIKKLRLDLAFYEETDAAEAINGAAQSDGF